MYGTQTLASFWFASLRFENDVKMYGTQTRMNLDKFAGGFENDVKMYGTQTDHTQNTVMLGLRMM